MRLKFKMDEVFPTRVGMNRLLGHLRHVFASVPHSRGDEPARFSAAQKLA